MRLLGIHRLLGGTRISTAIGDRLSRLAQATASKSRMAMPISSRISFGERFDRFANRRHVRPDRNQHDCARRHPIDGPALDLQSRRRRFIDATRRLRWPGQAAVVVSVVHIRQRRHRQRRYVLDGQPVDADHCVSVSRRRKRQIRTRLEQTHESEFQGHRHRTGMGFTFDDDDTRNRNSDCR